MLMMIRRAFRSTGIFALLAGALLASCDSPTGGGPEPDRLVVMDGDLQQAPVATQLPKLLVVRLLDTEGRPLAGELVNFHVTAGGGQLAAGAAVTNAEGEATDRWTLGTVAGDTQRVEAVLADAPADAPIVAHFRAVGRAGPVAALTPVTPATVTGTAGMPLADSVAVVVRDAHGNPVAGHTVAWTVTQGGGSASPAASTTNAEGVAKTRWTLGPAAGEQRLQAAASVSMTTTFVANAQGSAPPVLSIVSGNGQTGTAGTALPQPLVVEVRQNGVPVPGVGVIWAAGAGMGSLSAASPVTDAQGRAQATWTLGATPGTQAVSATVTGAGTVVFNATATAPVGPVITKVSGDAQTAPVGTPIEVVVEVRQNGVPVPGVTVAWSAPAGMGSVAPASSQTDAQGRALATWTLGSTPGAQSLSATAAGAGTVVFNATATAAPGPLVVTKISGDGQTGNVRTELGAPLVLEVRQNGVPVRDVRVVLTSTGGGWSVYESPLYTNPQGRVSIRWMLGDTVGVQTLTAHVAGVDPVTFTATVLGPGGSTQVLKVSGDGQTTLSGYRAAQNVVVRVVNAAGQGVPNVTVLWTGTAGRGSVSDAAGYAAQVAIGPREPGTGTVQATVQGLPPVNFSITSVPGPPNRLLAWENPLYLQEGGPGTFNRFTNATAFDSAGLGVWMVESPLTTGWQLLDNTGAVTIVYTGPMTNGRYLRVNAVGEDRLEISRGAAKDTVRVVVVPASAAARLPAAQGAARLARPAARAPSVGPASDRRRGRP
jgi:hypothetical protein